MRRLSTDLPKSLEVLKRAMLPIHLKLAQLFDLYDSALSYVSPSPRDDNPLHSNRCMRVLIKYLDIIFLHKESFFSEMVVIPKSLLLKGTHKQIQSCSVIIESCQVIDLSDVGALHPYAIWGEENTCSVDYDWKTNNLKVGINGLRLCLLSRFVQEIFIFYELAISRSLVALQSYWSHAVTARAIPTASAVRGGLLYHSLSSQSSYDDDVDSYDSEEVKARRAKAIVLMKASLAQSVLVQEAVSANAGCPVPPLQLCLNLSDLVVYVPRSSSSRDAVALKVSAAEFCMHLSPSSFPIPSTESSHLPESQRYFDPSRNIWVTTAFGVEKIETDAATRDEEVYRTIVSLSQCDLFACISSPLAK